MSKMVGGIPVEYLAALRHSEESRVARRGQQARNAKIRRKMARKSRRRNR